MIDKLVIYSEIDPLWYFIYDYLDLLRHTSAISDSKFACIFSELMDFVHSKKSLARRRNENQVIFEFNKNSD